MMFEPSSTFRRARLTTIALATAAFITLSDSALAQRSDRPLLDVPYVPTPPEVVDRMLEMAAVQPDDFVIDLGSGDGRIAIAAARKGARALGIDIDPERILEAQDNARKARRPGQGAFRRQNLFDTKIGDATVLTMYLLTKVNLDLRPRILEELKPGTRVVSHSFDMGNWKPDIHAEIEHRQVFMWIVPAKAAGRWQGWTGAESFGLDLQQEYQYLKGHAQIGGRTVEVGEGWLRGAEMHLILSDGRKLRGRVNGDRIELIAGGPRRQGGDKLACDPDAVAGRRAAARRPCRSGGQAQARSRSALVKSSPRTTLSHFRSALFRARWQIPRGQRAWSARWRATAWASG